MRLFKGIHFASLLSTAEEWHSFVVGFSEGICFWKSEFLCSEDYLRETIHGEYHYYKAGIGIGVLCIVFAIAVLVKWVIS